MASITKKNNKFYVIYRYYDHKGKRKQKWEPYKTRKEAEKRKKEVEYLENKGTFHVPNCTTLGEFLNEYVNIYGKAKWSASTYTGNTALIHNYIVPFIGKTKLSAINTQFLDNFYQKMLKTPAVAGGNQRKPSHEFVTPSTVQDIHKLLKSALNQAIKWEKIEKNPAINAIVPKYSPKERAFWTEEILQYVLDLDILEEIKLQIHLAFVCTLRKGELLGLTWDCVDISEEAINSGCAYISINKIVERVSKTALRELDNKDVYLTFPNANPCTTVRVLKKPKTEYSVRKVYLTSPVACALVNWKNKQDEIKELMGDEYHDYNLVMATTSGLPISEERIRKNLNSIIQKYNLPPIVFHGIRHSSVTYKLKLSQGNIKAVQGDAGDNHPNMMTDVYGHIVDEDRRQYTIEFEKSFYKKEFLCPQNNIQNNDNSTSMPLNVDLELLQKLASNPEMMALITALAKKLE